ncbi:mitochondrial RNA binding complex 1 subunit [Novymonas esmeraldas]|uniref:Mitochondrial RNA binding complex 1 subunit n=1 Tax=Novymonas esmeraldas TaxID=1808958 RepID=A0AAW0ELP5_9TRYP
MSSYHRGGGGRGGGGGGGRGRGRGRYVDMMGGAPLGIYEDEQRTGPPQRSFTPRDDDSDGEGGQAVPHSTDPPQPLHILESFLRRVDGSNYSQLKELTNRSYSLTRQLSPDPASVSIRFLRIQSDPFAPGSQVSVSVPAPFNVRALLHSAASTPPPPSSTGSVGGGSLSPQDVACRRVAAEDFVLRCVKRGLAAARQRSGAVQMIHHSQHVLPRSAVQLVDTSEAAEWEAEEAQGGAGGWLHVRFRVKLPGHGRRIDSRGIEDILLKEVLPVFQAEVLRCDHHALWTHVTSVHDQEWLRAQLRGRGLAAFIVDGAVLPRAAGDSDKPLSGPHVVPFASPASLQQSFHLPYSDRDIGGAGLPHGLTLIAGGGFHGKSTLLRALELGIYNHVPSDGRTFVVVDPTAVKIRAEDRRAVHGVDITPFITNLPYRDNTAAFATADASGSTSQAANIMEALELGSTALLLDEDTSATNFMYRDALMEQLVPRTQEPITSFVHRVRDLIHHHGVSVIMVVGGSGQYFPMADVVLVLNSYKVTDATAQAKQIVARGMSNSNGGGGAAAGELLGSAAPPATSAFHLPPQRRFVYADTFGALKGQGGGGGGGAHYQRGYGGHDRGIKTSGVGLERIRMADEEINIALVEQLVEEGQLNAIAQCLAMMYDAGSGAVAQWQQQQQQQQQQQSPQQPVYPPSLLAGLPSTTSDFGRLVYSCERRLRQARLEAQTQSCYLPSGFTTLPRVFEIGAALNRLRLLVTSGK